MVTPWPFRSMRRQLYSGSKVSPCTSDTLVRPGWWWSCWARPKGTCWERGRTGSPSMVVLKSWCSTFGHGWGFHRSQSWRTTSPGFSSKENDGEVRQWMNTSPGRQRPTPEHNKLLVAAYEPMDKTLQVVELFYQDRDKIYYNTRWWLGIRGWSVNLWCSLSGWSWWWAWGPCWWWWWWWRRTTRPLDASASSRWWTTVPRWLEELWLGQRLAEFLMGYLLWVSRTGWLDSGCSRDSSWHDPGVVPAERCGLDVGERNTSASTAWPKSWGISGLIKTLDVEIKLDAKVAGG